MDTTFFFYAIEVVLVIIWIATVVSAASRRSSGAWNWPMIGMLPALAVRVGRIHDSCTEFFRKSRRGTFVFQGPWFTDMEIVGTVNPANVRHVMSSNFQNFPKGPDFREMFDVLGDGIFNSDGESWKMQRKITRALIAHQRIHRFVAKISLEKMEKGLVPVLESVACGFGNKVIDLQDVFQRLTFDTTCALVTGYDPGCLSPDLPNVPFSKAMDDVEEAVFVRHVLPGSIWKVLRWIGVGSERKLKHAWGVLDEVIGEYISKKREELARKDPVHRVVDDQEHDDDLLTTFLTEGISSDQNLNQSSEPSDRFLRDYILNLMIAGRDTTSSALTWFTWLISTHPDVEKKIIEELNSMCPSKIGHVFQVEETSRLVYLHGALCEALRLYPPVPFQHKKPLEPDVLPSGHWVTPKTKVMFFLYAMGRMESIWGKDCLEFKPERWISERGTIKHEPSYKFLSFNAGPRTCLGKEVAFIQMKTVAATMVRNYEVRLVEGHRVEPNCSVILYMKDGLKVKVSKRIV